MAISKFAPIFLLLAGACAQASLVDNGSFEDRHGSFAGWTRSGDPTFTSVVWGNSQDGRYHAQVGPFMGMGYLSQNLATDIGADYELSFWLAVDRECNPQNYFNVKVDGTELFGQARMPGQGYTQNTFRFTALDQATTLTFGFYNVPSYFHLDNVSVTRIANDEPAPTPEPATFALLGLPLLAIGLWRRRSSN